MLIAQLHLKLRKGMTGSDERFESLCVGIPSCAL
jgi:hypothetical protein